ncbi:P-loop containing nucleoside triphosphate hydrolase protein [Thozetella sp. PMI_491]|nr:P-loop containing nucleoside triphosphate hydrolase protein [Thozetella sp. PMI_491]
MAGLACLTRIQDFLEKEPRQDFREYASSSSAVGLEKEIETSTTSEAIKIVEGSFGWTEEEFNLKGINATIPRSALTIVVGPIASGKSTLCKVLLGETPYNRGQVIMGTNFGKIGYCDQIPFLSNATIRENIVGFADFDQERYDEAIWATVLGRDLSLFPQGDRSRVGSNGITLSGGQKQRVSIARALYLQSSLLIFDDILSGLDADTEEAVFNRVFGPSGVLKRRNVTVVLCTHSIRHLPNSDHIIALAPDGTLVEEGNFEDLLANQKYVHGLGVKASGAESDSEERPPSISSETAIELARTKTAASATSEVIGTARQVGDTSVYAHYFNSIGAFWMSIFFLNGLLMGFLYNFPTIWLKFWSEDLVSPNPSHGNPFYIGIYTLLQVLTLISFWAAIVIGFRTLIVLSGTVLHKATLRTVMTAPLRFFTTTDSGVVLNFFSQDMTLIDSELPMSLVNFSIDGWIGIGAAAVIATSSPYVAISYPFLLALIYAIQRFYLRTSRQLRLLDLEAKSPLYTHFLDTIKGVATFRAFGWVDKGVIKNANLLDFSQRPAYLLAMIQRWLEFVLNITTMVLAVVVVTLATQLRSSSGFTGASLLSLMTFGEGIANVIRMYTMLETSIGAVARLKTFSEKTIPEDLPGETTIPPPSWPQKGNIEIKGVSASYGEVQEMEEDGETRSTPVLALKDLNLTIEPGQKVAICGRSGSGKSSTILLLVRLLDTLPECAGNMLIDGIPLNTVDRATLRRRIIAVPQDAVFLPDGTSFKTNLDPFNVSTPEECQIVLEAVDLWSFVSQRGGLDEGMTADSLSQGQKQLFSLARAMLRRRVRARELAADVGAGYLEGEKEGEVSKQGGVLLLDEVSSSVDVETDRAMQKIIHKEFEGYTIIMVSHRLEMVMDFDQVIIMDAGTVVESGKPKTLVTSEGSRFRDLWLVGNRE